MKEWLEHLSLATKALLLLVAIISTAIAIEIAVLDESGMYDNAIASAMPDGEDFLLDVNDGKPPGARPLADYHEITQRPLFNETRRPTAADVAPTVTARAISQLSQQWKLTGVVMAGDNTFVLVENKRDRRTVRLRKDEMLDGWRLHEIGADRISLASAKGSVSLELREADRNKKQ